MLTSLSSPGLAEGNSFIILKDMTVIKPTVVWNMAKIKEISK